MIINGRVTDNSIQQYLVPDGDAQCRRQRAGARMA